VVFRKEESPLALNTVGVGWGFRGGHIPSICVSYPWLGEGDGDGGYVPSERRWSLWHSRIALERGSGQLELGGCLGSGVGCCTVKFVGVCVDGGGTGGETTGWTVQGHV
jgi:hypothetical protein